MSYYNYDDRRKYEIDDFGALVGRTILDVIGAESESEEIRIVTDNGTLVMFHSQDCCEHVSIEDITGDVKDIVGKTVSVAEARSEDGNIDDYGSHTYTFYEIRTTGGDITIRWCGSSNGYYSESVDLMWWPVGVSL